MNKLLNVPLYLVDNTATTHRMAMTHPTWTGTAGQVVAFTHTHHRGSERVL